MKKIALMFVAAVLVAGCADGIIRPKVEDGIRKALPNYIGPAKEYSVRADGSTTDMLNGLIKRLHIEGTDVAIDPRMTVDRLLIDMDQVRYNEKRELTSVGSTTFTASLSEQFINKYMADEVGRDYNLKAKFVSGLVTVGFAPKVVGLNVPFSIDGRPEIIGGNKVYFKADNACLAKLPIPAFLVNKLLGSINPILDMSTMKFPATLTGIAVKNGEIVITGKAEFKPGE